MHGHTRAADGLKLMNRGDERGMITVVKVFPSRKIVSNLKMKTQGRKGREGRDGWKKKGRNEGRKGRRDEGIVGGRKERQEGGRGAKKDNR